MTAPGFCNPKLCFATKPDEPCISSFFPYTKTNKDADQLRGNREADQRLCFCYKDRTIPLLLKLLAIFCGCIDWFVSDLPPPPP